MRTATVSRMGATCAGLLAILAIAALILQYVLLVRTSGQAIGVGGATLRFASYFTILSNALVATVAAAAALHPWRRGFWTRPAVRAAVALYIGVTLVVYDRALAALWSPTGLQWLADAALHYGVPILYLAWWLVFVPHGALRLRHVARWLGFPLAYLMYANARGQLTGEWPYPFLDMHVLGYPQVARNALLVLGVFLVGGLLLLGIDRLLGRFETARLP